MSGRLCRDCKYRYRWLFIFNACEAEHVAVALAVHNAPWRTALCSVQRRAPKFSADVRPTTCGGQARFWTQR